MNTVEELCKWCIGQKDKPLSLSDLREKISQLSTTGDITQETYNNHPFLHYICLNTNVTLQMVECILDSFPGIASWPTNIFRWSDTVKSSSYTYAIHCACCNNCPKSVIGLLLKKYPPAIEHLSDGFGNVFDHIEYVTGLPLHCYIAYNPYIDIDVVKLLVEAYPQSLMVAGETKPLYPIHVAVRIWESPNLNILREIIEYFLKLNSTSLRVLDCEGNTPLHFACWKERMNLEVFKILYNSWPEAIRMSDSGGDLPLHFFCDNLNSNPADELAILKFMLDIDQTLLSVRNDEGELPIHRAVVNKSMTICKVLIDTYPQCLRVRTNNGKLPIHETLGRVDTVDTILYMLDIDQTILREINEGGELPIHHEDAFESSAICKILIDAYPESLRVRTNNGELPIHKACRFGEVDTILYMLKLYPESIRVRTNNGSLPIHIACKRVACKILIDAYPESLRARTNNGELPIHKACRFGKVDTILYMLELYPESIRVRTNNGSLPIHIACKYRHGADINKYMLELYPQSINVTNGYGNLPIHIAARHAGHDVIESLLKHDPTGASKKTTSNKEQLPLHIASGCGNPEAVQVLYDAFPEAIWIHDSDGKTPLDYIKIHDSSDSNSSWVFLRGRDEVSTFLLSQQGYAHKAKDTTTIMTPDENGWLPLHHALKDKSPLGSIKLLLKGNPSALMTANLNIAFPLHIACEFSPIKVVKYLIELDINGRILEHCDTNKDSVLHYACRGSNFGVIEYLLGNHASLVSDMNTDNKLPLHLLLEGCEDKRVKRSRKFTEACFLLLRAHPETVMVRTTRKRRRD